jgi:hypothetical protein
VLVDAVVADGVVVGVVVVDDVEPALGAPVPDPHPASSTPITTAPTIRGARVVIARTLRPWPSSDKGQLGSELLSDPWC